LVVVVGVGVVGVLPDGVVVLLLVLLVEPASAVTLKTVGYKRYPTTKNVKRNKYRFMRMSFLNTNKVLLRKRF
jgi:hypothetical protein